MRERETDTDSPEFMPLGKSDRATWERGQRRAPRSASRNGLPRSERGEKSQQMPDGLSTLSFVTGYRSCFICVCVRTIYIHTYVIEVDYRSYLQKESFPLFYGKFLYAETLLLKNTHTQILQIHKIFS